jgi:hypothetical protein
VFCEENHKADQLTIVAQPGIQYLHTFDIQQINAPWWLLFYPISLISVPINFGLSIRFHKKSPLSKLSESLLHMRLNSIFIIKQSMMIVVDWLPRIWSCVLKNQFSFTVLSFEYVKNWSQNRIKLMIVFFVNLYFLCPWQWKLLMVVQWMMDWTTHWSLV